MNAGSSGGASLFGLSWIKLKRSSESLRAIGEVSRTLFKPGRNIWKKERASRVSFLVDADQYFRSFAEAALRAQKQIFVLGWDLDTRTEIPLPDGTSIELGQFLSSLVRNRSELSIRILTWDFAFIYLFEREPLAAIRYSALSEDRMQIVLDQQKHIFASHHQKIVVIDDQIAFCGGLDLTQRRWDTSEHLANDPRRVDPGGHIYDPFHDVQICVEGDIARRLGELARERWMVATGEKILSAGKKYLSSPWPQSAQVDLQNIDVAIARTLPYGYTSDESGNPSKTVAEIERLFLDSIRSARQFVYIENQYFTSPLIARAIARRLSEPNGPEFVLVLPRDQTGLIEEGTMGLLRSNALRIVESADCFKRFRAYYPVVPDLDGSYLKVHSKVMIIDDEFVRIGSANLNRRSMGLDTECDLAIEAQGRQDARMAIAHLRSRLLAEHLGIEPEDFEARFRDFGSLLKTVESLRGSERNLVEIHPTIPEWVGKIAPPAEWIDPNAPRGIRRWMTKRLYWRRNGLGSALVIGTTILLFTISVLEARGELPYGLQVLSRPSAILSSSFEWIRSWDAEKISNFLQVARGESWAVPFILLGFVLGSFLFIPITAMILGVALVYPPVAALLLTTTGALIACAATYGLGRFWAWRKSRTFSRHWVRRLSQKLAKGGWWAVAAVRLAPIAPFTAVGIVAGGLKVRLRDYMIGSAVGLIPGQVMVVFVASGETRKLSERWPWILAALIAAFVFTSVIRHLLRLDRRSEA